MKNMIMLVTVLWMTGAGAELFKEYEYSAVTQKNYLVVSASRQGSLPTSNPDLPGGQLDSTCPGYCSNNMSSMGWLRSLGYGASPTRKGGITMEAWFKLDAGLRASASPKGMTILSLLGSDVWQNYSMLSISADGRNFVRSVVSGSYLTPPYLTKTVMAQQDAGRSLWDNQWHYVAVSTKDGVRVGSTRKDTMTFYLDSTCLGSQVVTSIPNEDSACVKTWTKINVGTSNQMDTATVNSKIDINLRSTPFQGWISAVAVMTLYQPPAYYYAYYQSLADTVRAHMTTARETSLNHTGIMLSAYPNPSDGRLTFSAVLPGTTRAKLQVYNAGGQLVSRLFDGSTSGQLLVPVQGYSAGTYFLRLEGAGYHATKTFEVK